MKRDAVGLGAPSLGLTCGRTVHHERHILLSRWSMVKNEQSVSIWGGGADLRTETRPVWVRDFTLVSERPPEHVYSSSRQKLRMNLWETPLLTRCFRYVSFFGVGCDFRTKVWECAVKKLRYFVGEVEWRDRRSWVLAVCSRCGFSTPKTKNLVYAQSGYRVREMRCVEHVKAKSIELEWKEYMESWPGICIIRCVAKLYLK